MSNIAFVFARGGSKGLPGKNVKPLMGKPLIQYSIEQANSSSLIDKVFVSTDDNEIALIAESLGAFIIQRPYDLAQDNSSEWLAWQHAVHYVKEHDGDFDRFVSLPATSPLRSVADIEAAINKLDSSNADLCLAITPASRSPYFNMVKKLNNDSIDLVISNDHQVKRRQDAPVIYDITTSVYVSTPSYILENTGIFSGNVTAIEVPKERSIDIDDIFDFKLAQVILEGSLC